MNTKNLLTLTLLATALTLNAALPKQYAHTSKQQANSISALIANILFNRGIDKDKALEISKNCTHENDELFALTLHNFINNSPFTQEEVLQRLSTMALQRKSIDFSSYSSLIQLTQELNRNVLNKEFLSKLEDIASKNSFLKKVFA